jgi:type II secretory pathway pseudopilin PulG
MEVLIVIAIIVIISVITFGAFSRYKRSQAVDINSRKILTALEEARGDTLDSLDGSQYGIRFYIDYAEVFKGASYGASGIVEVYELEEPVIIEEVSVGGGSDVIFERLTGRTANSGFVRIGAEGSDAYDKRIIIEATGLSYVE